MSGRMFYLLWCRECGDPERPLPRREGDGLHLPWTGQAAAIPLDLSPPTR